MKIKERALSILLALVMALAFMPAFAFAAEGEEASDFDGATAVGEPAEAFLEEAPAIKEGAKDALNAGDYIDANGIFTYTKKADGTLELYYREKDKAVGLTSLTIPTYVVLDNDGVQRPVTSIDYDALWDLPWITSVTVPSTVTEIDSHALGYYGDDYIKVPGFTIIGTTGTAAQTYAITNGFIFRDPVAEAEAARQGTPDGSIPKVKISKPSTGKKSITVKWKKLTKKQLKKSKAKSYEVWVSANPGFVSGETSEHIIKKSKSALKIKKVPKGTYYVKVRAIKIIGGVKYVGPWSKIKKVKVKK